MRRYVISYSSNTASQQGGTFFHAADDDTATNLCEAIAQAQTPHAWKTLSVSLATRDGDGQGLRGTYEAKLNVKYRNGVLGHYHFPMVPASKSLEDVAQALQGAGPEDPSAPVSPSGEAIQQMVTGTQVNFR